MDLTQKERKNISDQRHNPGGHLQNAELTQDVLSQDLCCPCRLRASSSIHRIDPKLALFALLQVRNNEFSGWVELVSRVYPSPVRAALLMDLDDVTFDWAATIFVWWTPAQSDAVLGLVFNLWSSRRAGRV